MHYAGGSGAKNVFCSTIRDLNPALYGSLLTIFCAPALILHQHGALEEEQGTKS